MQAVQWIMFLSQRTFLFALGALSALGAKKDAWHDPNPKPISSAALNQQNPSSNNGEL